MHPVILPRSEHPISRQHIDPDALKILYRLKQAGHIAYLVGGGVRDLLLNRRPKDFDISTSAHPNEVKRLFRNCRLIGRRFRLAHILFGRDKFFEVATFRRKASEAGSDEGDDLLVRRENTFGTPEEDATRRDITINGLFYDIATLSVIDYVGGLRDLESRVIRTIGDPAVRMREDPIRMLRAVKFASRLGFDIGSEDLAALSAFGPELLRAAPERLLLEIGRLLGGGHAEPAFRLLHRTGLLAVIGPEVVRYLDGQRAKLGSVDGDALWSDLAGLDQVCTARRESGTAELSSATLLATLLTPVFLPAPAAAQTRRGLGFAAGAAGAHRDNLESEEELAGGVTSTHDDSTAIADRLGPIVARLTIPRRESERLAHLIAAQRRLRYPGRRSTAHRPLARKSYFDDALVVLEAHVLGTGEHDAELLLWQRTGAHEAPARAALVEPRRERRGRRVRSHPPRAAERDAQAAGEAPVVTDASGPDIGEGPAGRRRPARRRRQRRPAAQGRE